ncbi:MAG: hypothetical protein R3C02_14165 [Planctomycetaceae bacterium]
MSIHGLETARRVIESLRPGHPLRDSLSQHSLQVEVRVAPAPEIVRGVATIDPFHVPEIQVVL